LSWHPPNQKLVSWIDNEIDLRYIELLLTPEHMQSYLDDSCLPDGLRLLPKLDTLPSHMKLAVVSAFGLDSLKLLTERMGAAYTIQKYPDLRRIFQSQPSGFNCVEQLRSKFDRDLSSGLRKLYEWLISNESGPLIGMATVDQRARPLFRLSDLVAEHRLDAIRTLKLLYHCPPDEPDWQSTSVDESVLALHLRSFFETCMRPERRAAGRFRKALEDERMQPLRASIIGKSRAIENVRERICTLARTSDDVLLTGPTGSGKELVAHSLHDLSNRKMKPFVTFDCAQALAGDPTMIGATLFGHEKDAYTGTTRLRRGVVEDAAGGILFIDQFEDAGRDIQAKLLRLVETKQIQRVGSNEWIDVDVRIVFATRIPPEELERSGELRDDLSGRIPEHATVVIPGLDERREDIIPLATYFWESKQRDRTEISQDAWDLLESRHWRSNVRGIRDAMRHLAEVYKSGISAEDIRRTLPERTPPLVAADVDQWSEEEIQKRKVLTAVAQSRASGRISLRTVAARAGIAPSTVRDRIRRWREASDPRFLCDPFENWGHQ